MKTPQQKRKDRLTRRNAKWRRVRDEVVKSMKHNLQERIDKDLWHAMLAHGGTWSAPLVSTPTTAEILEAMRKAK